VHGKLREQRGLFGAASAIMIGAVAIRLATAGLTRAMLAEEATLLLIGTLFAAVAVVVRTSHSYNNPAIRLLLTLDSAVLAGAILVTAAPRVPDVQVIAVLIGIVIMLSADLEARDRVQQGALVIAVMGALATLGASAPSMTSQNMIEIGTLMALLVSVAMLFVVNWNISSARVEARMAFTRAVANAASRIGMGQSVESVARATLEACRDSYPGVTDGGILLISEDRSTLTPIPVVLSPGGVANAEPAALFSLNPGSGLAGSAFTEGAARLAATQQALRLVHVGRVPVPGSPITDRGVRCAVAAPLRSPGRGVIGVLTLGSSVR
jgi:hypothetical protein